MMSWGTFIQGNATQLRKTAGSSDTRGDMGEPHEPSAEQKKPDERNTYCMVLHIYILKTDPLALEARSVISPVEEGGSSDRERGRRLPGAGNTPYVQT